MTIQELLTYIGSFFADYVLPLMFSVAFFFFIWNAFRYFILGGANPDDQEKAKKLAIWGIAAFVVLGLWGMVKIVVDTFDVGDTSPITPDYVKERSDA